ncbi:hypothetical protein F652_3208 [Enterobacteriaceae bacterium bta3-1]|nr:hypothetical protein F652_3208 [Enterobacteriaceae bacterium bta3-1]
MLGVYYLLAFVLSSFLAVMVSFITGSYTILLNATIPLG